jgi:hypothetical protein
MWRHFRLRGTVNSKKNTSKYAFLVLKFVDNKWFTAIDIFFRSAAAANIGRYIIIQQTKATQ